MNNGDLVGGWTTHLKNMLVKLDHLPRDRGKNQKYLKPPAVIREYVFFMGIWSHPPETKQPFQKFVDVSGTMW